MEDITNLQQVLNTLKISMEDNTIPINIPLISVLQKHNTGNEDTLKDKKRKEHDSGNEDILTNKKIKAISDGKENALSLVLISDL
ncbi:hypothetical protein Dimus_032001 [Dionaea muscipula]